MTKTQMLGNFHHLGLAMSHYHSESYSKNLPKTPELQRIWDIALNSIVLSFSYDEKLINEDRTLINTNLSSYNKEICSTSLSNEKD